VDPGDFWVDVDSVMRAFLVCSLVFELASWIRRFPILRWKKYPGCDHRSRTACVVLSYFGRAPADESGSACVPLKKFSRLELMAVSEGKNYKAKCRRRHFAFTFLTEPIELCKPVFTLARSCVLR